MLFRDGLFYDGLGGEGRKKAPPLGQMMNLRVASVIESISEGPFLSLPFVIDMESNGDNTEPSFFYLETFNCSMLSIIIG